MSSPRKMRSKEALHLAKVELIVSVICMAAQCSIHSNDKKKDEAARYITDLLSPSVPYPLTSKEFLERKLILVN